MRCERKIGTTSTVSARVANSYLQRTPWKTCRPGLHVCGQSVRASRPRWSSGSRESSNRGWGRRKEDEGQMGECTVNVCFSGRCDAEVLDRLTNWSVGHWTNWADRLTDWLTDSLTQWTADHLFAYALFWLNAWQSNLTVAWQATEKLTDR